MDVIGTLAAFAAGDLAKLQYTTANNGTMISISKFIIIFPLISFMVYGNAGIGYNGTMLITPGNVATINYTESALNTIRISFLSDKQTIMTDRHNISIAYCPV